MTTRGRAGSHPDKSCAARAIQQLRHHCVEAVTPSGDLVVLHVPSGTYLRLEGSASTIVDLLVDYGDVGATARELADRFDIPVARAEADVRGVVTAIDGLHTSRSSTARRPTLAGVVDTCRAWLRLTPDLMTAVASAVVMVILVEVGLRCTDLDRLARLMRVPLAVGAPSVVREDDEAFLSDAERRDYWAATWVLDRWIFDGTCLRRALVTGWFLRRHHPSLQLGLIDDGATSHAWIEAEGVCFNAIPVTGVFTSRRVSIGN